MSKPTVKIIFDNLIAAKEFMLWFNEDGENYYHLWMETAEQEPNSEEEVGADVTAVAFEYWKNGCRSCLWQAPNTDDEVDECLTIIAKCGRLDK